MCAGPLRPRTKRRCLGPNRSQESSGPAAGVNVHSMSVEGVAKASATNCALAEASIKNERQRKKAALRPCRLFPAHDLLDLPFEQAIVVVLLQHSEMHLADRLRAE
jgi:hypothetical protein